MTDQPAISVFVKLKAWDVYLLNVVLMVVVRRFFYAGVAVALAWIGLNIYFLASPANGEDWAAMMKNDYSLWAPLLILQASVFILPLLSLPRIMRQPRVKEGIRYQFAESGVHVETCVSTSDLKWKGIPRVVETRSMFMIFTSSTLASTIPKRCFENVQDIAALRKLLRAEVKKVTLRRS